MAPTRAAQVEEAFDLLTAMADDRFVPYLSPQAGYEAVREALTALRYEVTDGTRTQARNLAMLVAHTAQRLMATLRDDGAYQRANILGLVQDMAGHVAQMTYQTTAQTPDPWVHYREILAATERLRAEMLRNDQHRRYIAAAEVAALAVIFRVDVEPEAEPEEVA